MKAVLPNENVRATFGEGPLWDDENQCLFWVDNAEYKIRVYYPKSRCLLSASKIPDVSR